MDVGALDRAIQQMKQLEGLGAVGDPGHVSDLQSAIVAGLKSFEFTLWRKLNGGLENQPALGALGQVPPEYRALVEEYYRALAGKKPDH
jgi:hypothetical protein